MARANATTESGTNPKARSSAGTSSGKAAALAGIAPSRAVSERVAAHALLLGFLLYAAWATKVTWPLLASPSQSVLGGLGDQTGAIAHVREWIQDGLFPLAPGTVRDFSAPEGLAVGWGVNLASWSSTLPIWLIALVTGPTAAFAITTWLGIVLSGTTMQILATRLTRSRPAGVVAGFAFAFYPYAIMKAAGHPIYAHGWPLALMAWRLLEVAETPTRRNTAAAVVAAIVCVGFTPYYALIGGVLLATCMVLALVTGYRRGELRTQINAQLWIGAAVAACTGALAALALRGTGTGSLREHASEELVKYSARVHEYFVPFAHSYLFGDATRSWLAARQHGSNFSETTLYLGLSVLAVAFAGGLLVLQKGTPARLRAGFLAAAVVALVGFVWSAPPQVTVGDALLPAPSKYVSEITTTWRVYSRFVVVVMIGVSAMAAVGVAALTRRRPPLVAGAITALVVAAIAIDYTWRPGVTKLQNPPVYGLLKARPGGLVAQYPLLPAGYGDSTDVLYQQAHGHRIVNGYAETGFEDRRALTLYYLNQLRTARGLASLGVRYVIRPDDPAAFAGTPDPGLPRAGFELIGRGRYHNATASVYEVTAPPDAGYVYLRVGGAFWTEGPTEDPFVWVTDQEAELAVDAPLCTKRCRGELALRISSFGMPREVTLRLGRRVLWRGRVADRRDVAIPLEVDGRAAVTITTAPGPVRIQDLDPSSPDERSISVNLSRMRFTKAPARRSSP